MYRESQFLNHLFLLFSLQNLADLGHLFALSVFSSDLYSSLSHFKQKVTFLTSDTGMEQYKLLMQVNLFYFKQHIFC